ncbi:3-galactosyl-N-acetylglucosaminide 4-alpha-L-fucosyltransferase FUT3-like [Apostichopus japonicus]|uniref:3-galactosyl-N-acetylglucosaminide 4-alpha-L-fucosyltransferase FUT3-like n=1 Tax=Stichopus japonicus TaxID=307972 RepID=UPI003AB6A165
MSGENRRKRFVYILVISVVITAMVWLHGTSTHEFVFPDKFLTFKEQNNRNLSLVKSIEKSVVDIHFPEKSRYDFVAFKEKPGWHFVHFPCHYTCKKDGAPVTVRFTTNASDVAGADAVFFTTGPMELEEWEALHRYRSPGQIWIFATQEPAAIVPDYLPPKVYRYDTYNWSFTFHSTSDIHGAYGWYTPYDKVKSDTKSTNWYKKKPKFASWVSSLHCGGLGWDRTKFVEDLGEFIPIDMYGACGNLTMRRNTKIAKGIFMGYKFHLSLENSCCSEYLTEKVWNALQNWESVPIVLGGTREEYSRLMPPHSYIHADDFDSIEDLARYINKVGGNETLYNAYFDWRRKGKVQQQGFNYRFPFYQEGVCKIVHDFEKMAKHPMRKSFDPYGANWFGSCYRCGTHNWIQEYNIWWRRNMFRKLWEDNRTLIWLDGVKTAH